MEIISIQKNKMAGALLKAQAVYTLAGPIKTSNGHTFRPLEQKELPDLEYTHTDLSAKSLVFPQEEVLFSFENDRTKSLSQSVREPYKESEKTAAVGIRPYDAKAIEMLRLNFDTPEAKDPYFIRRFESLTLVGLAENTPDAANFSSSCNTGPFDESGLDILLVDIGEAYAGKILTPKGEAFSGAAGFPGAGASLWEKAEKLKTRVNNCCSPAISFVDVLSKQILEIYESPIWEDLAFACVNCSTCTFVCPTCWCFDIQDETARTKGTRFKLWDSCMSDLYSAHASGHNPREKGWHRFRNRFMHKLKYFPDKYGRGVMCVGCGRCIRSCPAGIDIRKIVSAMAAPVQNHSPIPVKEVVR